ncbi:MAG: GPP34 family phosphoprotein [Kiritimatiellae bacterium]|nr:GPP34 family phosphoprotein [Kiritimatiellia bacterium]
MLSFAEEIYLLALNETTGKIEMPNKNIVLNNALVGAVLGELSFLSKIDSDAEFIYILNTEPTGRPIIDLVLEQLAALDGVKIPSANCIGSIFFSAAPLEEMVRTQLIEKGILKEEKGRILWVFPTRRYPIIDNREIKDVETRLREILLSDDIPDPRDTVLIGLAELCGLIEQILSPKEYQRCGERIALLSRMDLVTQKVRATIVEICNQFASPATWDAMM